VRLLLAACLATLLWLAPQAAFAHGDEPHAGEGAGKAPVASHPCPGGTGDCCCAKPLATPAKPPALSAAPWRLAHVPAALAPAARAPAFSPSRPYLPGNPRAPPPSS
jgi:hypothetical protein